MADLSTTNQGFNDTENSLHPYSPNIKVDNFIQQALSRLMGFDALNHIWRNLKTDQDGRLYVSTSASQNATAVNSAVTVAQVSIQLLAANPNRKQLVIQNLGANNIFFTYGATAIAATGIAVQNNQTYIDNSYVGVVTAISLVGNNDVRILES
jgi:glucose/arabinose dehydrogenase